MKIHLDTDEASSPAGENIRAAIDYLVTSHREAVRGALETADEREWMADVLALSLDVELES